MESTVKVGSVVCRWCNGTRMCQSCNGSGEKQLVEDCYEDNCYADCSWCNASGYCPECCADHVRRGASGTRLP